MDNPDITNILESGDNGHSANSLSSSTGVILNIATITCIGVFGFVIGVGISKFVSRTLAKPTDHDDVDDSGRTGQLDPPKCHLETMHQAALRLVACDLPPMSSLSLSHVTSHIRTCTNSTKDDTDIENAHTSKDPEEGIYRPTFTRVPSPQPMTLPAAVRSSLTKPYETSKSSDCHPLRRSGCLDPDNEYQHIRKESV